MPMSIFRTSLTLANTIDHRLISWADTTESCMIPDIGIRTANKSRARLLIVIKSLIENENTEEEKS
jgi:hypothetical protein